MVQWVEHLANWLRPVHDAMWRDVLASGYVQVDETPVRVLDPDVTGKAPRGYLCSTPRPATTSYSTSIVAGVSR